MLVFLLILALLMTAASVFWIVTQSGRTAAQVELVTQAQMQAQRVAKSAIQSLAGDEAAFDELGESSAELSNAVRAMREGGEGDEGAVALGAGFAEVIEGLSLIHI